jgi:Kef-type K+ transport system membrane component KefB
MHPTAGMPELPLTDPIIQFTILVTAALAVQLTVERAHMPGLLGLLVLGVLLGPAGAQVLAEGPVVPMLGQIGLIYVMFIAGLEIDLRIVREHRSAVAAFGLLAFFLSATPAAAGGLLFGMGLPAALLMGALVSSHTLLAYPILMRLQLLRRLPVVTAVGGTLITDTLALVVLAVVLGVHRAEAGAMDWLMPLLLLAALTALALWAVPRASRFVFERDDVTQAEKALFALAVLMILATAAEIIGTDEILGAFLAGVAMNRVLARREQLREHLEFVGRMLFIPFFFIWTGTLLDVEVMTQDSGVWITAGALLAVVVFGKLAAAAITGSIFDFDWRERLLMTGLTIPQAAATLAVTITAREAGLFAATLVDAVIIVIFVTCIIGPVVTERLGRRMSEEVAAPDERARGEAMHPQVDHDEDDVIR